MEQKDSGISYASAQPDRPKAGSHWRCGTGFATRSLRAAALGALSLASPAFAAQPAPPPQPPVDLGQTSFLDAEGGPGPLLELVGQGYGATRINDAAGHNADPHFDQTVGSGLAHLVYTSNITILGAKLGGEVLVPIAGVHARSTSGTVSGTGIGDMFGGPELSWSKLHFLGRPLALRATLDITAPTGAYRRDRAVNAGLDAWQISPYVAATWRPTARTEWSVRLIYDWSGVSHRPPSASGLLSRQAGDQFAVNLATSYAVSHGFRLGIASYALQQLHDAKADGVAIPDTRQRIFAAGPGFLWTVGRTTFIGNYFREFEARNRPQGNVGLIRALIPL